MNKSKLYILGLNVRDELLKKNGHFTVREFKRSMNLCLYKAMDPTVRQRYMVSFFLNTCAIYSFGSPETLPEVNGNFPYFEDGTASFEEAIFEIKKVMYAKGDQNFDVGTVLAILIRLDQQYGWDFNKVAKTYGHTN